MMSIGGSVMLALSIAYLARKISGSGGLIGMLEVAFGPLRGDGARLERVGRLLDRDRDAGGGGGQLSRPVAGACQFGVPATTIRRFAASILVWLVTLISLIGLKQAQHLPDRDHGPQS